MVDPVGAAIDDLNDKWKKTVDALKEGGATADQMADAQKLYKLELDQVKASTKEASADLKDFRDQLAFGSSSPYSLRDQEAKAKEKLQPFLDQIAGGQTVDQSKYIEAAQQFLDIERQLYGSTAKFFEAMDQIQAATGSAISSIDNAVPVRTVSDPFNEQTATNTATTNQLLDQVSGQLNTVNGQLGALVQLMGSGGGAGGGSFIGGAARGFVNRA
jgi:chromosome segregation ATPase